MDIFLIKIMSAHLLGDFFFQPGIWAKDKQQKKLKSAKLYWHVLVHIGLIFLLFFSLSVWPVAISVGIIHLIIDALKAILQTRKNARLLFFVDQALHLVTLVLVWLVFTQKHLDGRFLDDPKIWLIAAGVAFLTMPTSIMMRVIIAKWLPEEGSDSPKSLQNAGKYIGILERVLIFIFIIDHHFEAVGFLLAAKSIFRFGDLKEAQDLRLTEYVLIGTLLSFGIAIGTALVIEKMVILK